MVEAWVAEWEAAVWQEAWEWEEEWGEVAWAEAAWETWEETLTTQLSEQTDTP